ncbi:MAG TPA: ABC transporter ATP-binding protein [Casimicrobiaceae bacterium]|nr:ABC transporter ATP-binding protein [Casimicrobiaceae bacterium]
MLRVERICVHYGAAPALWDVSLNVEEGELVCIVGPNGAGKSTLINTIAGLNRVTSGALSFSGRDLGSLPAHRFVSEGIAIVPEGRRLFGAMTVRENLELGSLAPSAKAARHASLERACAMFPALASRLQHPASALSGGQQQMVAIARALMARPRLLLLDEPSLGLAPAIVIELFRSLRRINAEGTAVLLVEQNVAAALDISARAYVLDEGRVIAEGAPEALLAQPHIHRAYLGLGTS